MNKLKAIIRFTKLRNRLRFIWDTFWDWDIPDYMWIEIVSQALAPKIEVSIDSEYSAEYWNARAKRAGKQ